MPPPPVAPQRPHVLTAHGHQRQDPWFWLRDADDPEVIAYLTAENDYADQVLAPLASRREELFEEMKARIQETDMSVPVRRGAWWYYGRTEEGKSYGIHYRRPAGEPDQLPPVAADEIDAEEQVLLDENALAEGHEYFAVGTASVSPDHEWLAYGTDTTGDEKYVLAFRPLGDADPALAIEQVADTGYGVAWSKDASVAFYVRLDEAMRPYQLWRHALGTDPANDALVFEEEDRRFSLGTGLSRDDACILVSLHSTNTTEWLAIPADDPLAAPRLVIPRREGVEYAVEHMTSYDDGAGWFVVMTNDTREGLPGHRRTGPRPGHPQRLARGGAPPSRRPH